MYVRLLTGLLLSLAIAVASADEQHDEKLKRVDRELGEVQRWLKGARKQQSTLIGTLRKTETEIASLNNQVTQLRRDIRSGEKRAANLTREQARLQQEIENQKRLLYQQIRASHMSGQQEYLKLLLNQSQPEIVLRMLKYYEYFHRARLERIRGFHERLQQLDKTKAELQQTTATLTRRRATLSEQLELLRGTREARLGAVKELESSIRERDQRRAQLTKDRQHLEALIQAMRHAIPDMPAPSSDSPFPDQKGKLRWPARGKLLNTGSRLHDNGIFINAPAGRDVQAIHHGQVVFADWMRRFGMVIIIDHGDGYMSLYAHNRNLLKSSGEWVRSGEKIAQVGDSGGQARSGLYFEIRHQGKPQKPAQWCQARR